MQDTMPKVAVIGCGHWGKNHIRVMHELGALAAVCDADPAVAARFAEEYQVPAVAMEDIAGSPLVDAAVVATPAVTHGNWLQRLLEAGKHVLVEKPLCLDIAQGKRMVALAESRGLTLMVGHILQYHPAFQTLKTCIADGVIGKLGYIHASRRSTGKIRSDEDVWWSFAPHDVSMVLALTGQMPRKVSAQASCLLQEGIADIVNADMMFGDVHAHFTISWLHPFKEHRLIAVGDKGTIVFDDTKDWGEKLIKTPPLAVMRDGAMVAQKGDAEPIAVAASEPLKDECRQFLDAVRGKGAPLTDGQEGVAVLEVLRQGVDAYTPRMVSRAA